MTSVDMVLEIAKGFNAVSKSTNPGSSSLPHDYLGSHSHGLLHSCCVLLRQVHRMKECGNVSNTALDISQNCWNLFI